MKLCAKSAPTLALLCVIGNGLVGCIGPDPDGPGSLTAITNAQKSSEDKLTAAGAKLKRNSYPPGDAWAVDLSGASLNDEVWAALKGLDRIAELDFSGTNLADGDITKLAALKAPLTKLNFSKTALTNQGLEQVESPFLMQVDVSETKVTAEGVSQFLKKRADDSSVSAGFKKPAVKR